MGQSSSTSSSDTRSQNSSSSDKSRKQQRGKPTSKLSDDALMKKITSNLKSQNESIQNKIEQTYSIQTAFQTSQEVHVSKSTPHTAEALTEVLNQLLPEIIINPSCSQLNYTQIQLNWYEYAEEECELINQKRSYAWVENMYKLLQLMKSDPRVKEYQKNSLISLLFTIESMTEIEYLRFPDEIEASESKMRDQRAKTETQHPTTFSHLSSHFADTTFYNNPTSNSVPVRSIRIASHTSDCSGASETLENQSEDDQYKLYRGSEMCDDASFIMQRISGNNHSAKERHRPAQESLPTKASDIGLNQSQRLQQSNAKQNTSPQTKVPSKNLKTLIEGIPVFEEELEENILGIKSDSNMMRSEIFTVLGNPQSNVQFRDQIRPVSQIYQSGLRVPSTIRQATSQQQQAQFQRKNEKHNTTLLNPSIKNSETGAYEDGLRMVNFYKRVSGFLEKSLEHKHNALRAVLKLYKAYFLKQYGTVTLPPPPTQDISIIVNKITEQQQQQQQVSPLNAETLVQDVQQFLHFFLFSTIFFFDLENVLQFKQFSSLVNKENLWNFLTNILFDDPAVYSSCFRIISKTMQPEEEELQRKMKVLADLRPEQIDIHPKFCLNNVTIQYMNNKDGLSPLQHSTIQSQFSPYADVVEKLREILLYQSPIHKMKVILACFEMISTCIDQFHFKYLKSTKSNMLSGDDLINILVFIILKSQLASLPSQMKFISSFLTKSTQQSKIGYSCTTMLVVLDYLNQNRILEIIEKHSNSNHNSRNEQGN